MIKDIDCPIADLLPHNHPLILIDRVVDYTEDTIHTIVNIRNDSPFFENGAIPSYIGLEYMAQTVGAWTGLMARQQNQEPKIGFLLGSRKLILNVPTFKEGSTLDIHGLVKYNDGEMGSFECWVEIDGEQVVQANLNVFQPSNIAPLLTEAS